MSNTLTLLIVILSGTVCAIVATLASRGQTKSPDERSVTPYVGFLVGAIIGAVVVIGWSVFID